MAATLTSKGQVTIPKAVRSRLHLKAGDKVEFVFHENGVEMIPVSGSVRDLKGMLAKPDRPISLEEMDRSIREAAG